MVLITVHSSNYEHTGSHSVPSALTRNSAPSSVVLVTPACFLLHQVKMVKMRTSFVATKSPKKSVTTNTQFETSVTKQDMHNTV